MSRTKYVGRHRVVEEATRFAKVVKNRWTRRILVPTSVFAALVLGVGSTAFADPIHVASGDTFSALVQTHCGTGNWEAVSFPNRDKNLIYAGETIDLTCYHANGSAAAAQTASTPAPPAPQPKVQTSSTGWFSPLPGHTSYCNYWQWRGNYNHRGEDIPAGSGTPIHAVHSGNVRVQWDGGGGNMTIITHDGMAEVYMHQSSYAVRSGWVNGGDVIGYVGSTGDASGPHLHLEIQPNGPWNGVTSPDRWLADRGVYIGC
jgi:murein DD-endopeptidase MepM/ murein hydrolase activator NlpD